jgi:hypothetical protein
VRKVGDPERITARRPRGWLRSKLKRDYRTELSDTVDLVLVGALTGRGPPRRLRRAAAGRCDPATNMFRTVRSATSGNPNAELAAGGECGGEGGHTVGSTGMTIGPPARHARVILKANPPPPTVTSTAIASATRAHLQSDGALAGDDRRLVVRVDAGHVVVGGIGSCGGRRVAFRDSGK